MTNQQAPEALRLADALASNYFDGKQGRDVWDAAAVELRRLHAENDRLAAMVDAQQPATHVQNPAEIEHVAGDVSKNGAESNMAHQPAPSAAANLHPKTADLVQRFAAALADKLAAAEKKYGYSDGWASPDWMDECRLCLREHLFKGDPRDVAAYCAFLWHHGESTALPSEVVEDRVKEFEQLFPARKSSTPQADESPIPADYGGEPRTDCGLEGAYPKIVWIANTLYAMRHMHTLDSTWRGQLITMAAAANFVAKQIAALEPTPQADSQPAPVPVLCPACSYQHGHAIGCENNPVDISLAATRACAAASAPADSVTAPAESDWDVRGHLATSLSFWHRLKNGEDDELVAAFRKLAPPSCTIELDELRKAFRPHDLTQEWTSEHSRNYPGKAARIINAASAAVLTATATPPAQAALEDAALSSEQQRAIFEAYESAASESYFEVRPQIDCNDRRRVFKAGYERGWDAARKQGANHD